jgi:ketosteroid isomerase-like protein
VRVPAYLLAVVALAATPGAVRAAAEEPAAAAAVAVVERCHAALAGGDRDAALAQLAPGVVIFEAGGAERSREEYAHHHLAGDLEFAGATTSEVVDRRSGVSGDLAWVLTRSRTHGTFRGKEVKSEATETMLLELAGGAWRIVHVHWSSRKAG